MDPLEQLFLLCGLKYGQGRFRSAFGSFALSLVAGFFKEEYKNAF